MDREQANEIFAAERQTDLCHMDGTYDTYDTDGAGHPCDDRSDAYYGDEEPRFQ